MGLPLDTSPSDARAVVKAAVTLVILARAMGRAFVSIWASSYRLMAAPGATRRAASVSRSPGWREPVLAEVMEPSTADVMVLPNPRIIVAEPAWPRSGQGRDE